MDQFDPGMPKSLPIYILYLSHKKVKKQVHKQSSYPAFRFIYILMHGREEWVLVQLGSQHKHIKWTVQSVFSEYLSIFYDCVVNYIKIITQQKAKTQFSSETEYSSKKTPILSYLQTSQKSPPIPLLFHISLS